MEYGLVEQLILPLPLAYAGLCATARPPTPIGLPSRDYIGIYYSLIERHFVLSGSLDGFGFQLDSKHLQATNCCGVYVCVFAYLILLDLDLAEKVFLKLVTHCGTQAERLINDMVMIETLVDILQFYGE